MHADPSFRASAFRLSPTQRCRSSSASAGISRQPHNITSLNDIVNDPAELEFFKVILIIIIWMPKGWFTIMMLGPALHASVTDNMCCVKCWCYIAWLNTQQYTEFYSSIVPHRLRASDQSDLPLQHPPLIIATVDVGSLRQFSCLFPLMKACLWKISLTWRTFGRKWLLLLYTSS